MGDAPMDGFIVLSMISYSPRPYVWKVLKDEQFFRAMILSERM